MPHPLAALGFYEVEVRSEEATIKKRLEEVVSQLGPVEADGAKLYEEALALIADGTSSNPSLLASTVICVVRGAATINEMLDRLHPVAG
jgi:hypothetical protein